MTTAEARVPFIRSTLGESVRSEVERMILAGEFAAGEKLNEVAIADALDVSRGTVREAIRTLADTGLIALVANRGAYVRRLSVAEIANLYETRGAIFAMACGAVARRRPAIDEPELLARLDANLAAMRRAQLADDRAAYYTLNIAFHDLILDAAENARAKSIYDRLVKEMHLFRRRGLSLALNIQRSLEEHGAIVEAIRAGDPEAARAAAARHIECGLGRFRSTLAEADELGS
ncbi:GntR family transcriptional regulator [Acuticoccus sp.]|uniref:GntR family transcriptional regulator n=1 Tax=Acuticoccus sp. TaxID=1904378 RepID=UPI003B52647A